MDKHVLVILPNVEHDEHLRIVPCKEFLAVLNAVQRSVDERTKTLSVITLRKVTADLAEFVLNANGFFKVPVKRFAFLRPALVQPEFGCNKCEYELISNDEDLEKDNANAWHQFCFKMVKIGNCKTSLRKIPNDKFRFPAFQKELFVENWSAPSKVYIVPGKAHVDIACPAPMTVKTVKKVLELLLEDDTSTVAFVGGRSSGATLSEAMVMSTLLLVSDVPARKEIPSRLAILTSGTTMEEKAGLIENFIETVTVNAKKKYLVVAEPEVAEMKALFKNVKFGETKKDEKSEKPAAPVAEAAAASAPPVPEGAPPPPTPEGAPPPPAPEGAAVPPAPGTAAAAVEATVAAGEAKAEEAKDAVAEKIDVPVDPEVGIVPIPFSKDEVIAAVKGYIQVHPESEAAKKYLDTVEKGEEITKKPEPVVEKKTGDKPTEEKKPEEPAAKPMEEAKVESVAANA